MKTAPIALFVYNRPWHTRQTVEALLKNELAPESDLIVFSDGPKTYDRRHMTDDRIRDVREYIKTIKGFKSVRIVEGEKNIGLANSIISGVTDVVNEYGRIIALEDDMLTSPYFLTYMNEALNLYERDEEVISIHGYSYPISGLPETYFIKGADCWGWATWKRGWDLFETDGKKLLHELKRRKLTRRFDFDGAYPYTKMLEDQIRGKNDSWAIRWYASAFLEDKLTLFPGKSLIANIGFDSSGTHCGKSVRYSSQISDKKINLEKIRVIEHNNAYELLKTFLESTKPNYSRIITNRNIKRLIPTWIKKIRRKYFCSYGYKGIYSNWQEAYSQCGGYENPEILKKVREAMLKVKHGQALGERDTVLLYELPKWPPLDLLQTISNDNYGSLTVIDYGGALGNLYFQVKKKLGKTDNLKWIVIEQPHFVECGNNEFADGSLQFMHEWQFSALQLKADVLILSSVIQYFEKPYEKLRMMLSKKIFWIIVDRTPFNRASGDILTRQKVNPRIYKANYPAWLLDNEKFLSVFAEEYELIHEFTPIDFDYRAAYKGYIFQLKQDSKNDT